MSIEDKPNIRVIPPLEIGEEDIKNLDTLHVKLFQQLSRNSEKIEKFEQFQRRVEQSKKWLVKNNSKGVSTLGLGLYKCPKRKAVDKKIEKCLTWLIMKYNKMFRCFLTKTERALIRKEIEEHKIVKNEITKSRREIPVKKEDGSVDKKKKIKVKVLKTVQDLRRELKMDGGLTVSEEAIDVITQKNCCCKRETGKADKCGKKKIFEVKLKSFQEDIIKSSEKRSKC